MARGIVVNWNGEISSFAPSKVDREKLYGRKERVVVDQNGERCSSAYLTADGTALIPQGGYALTYLDPDFNTLERSELVATGSDGQPLTTVSTTLGIAQPLLGPVAPQRVLDFQPTSVYLLDPEDLGPELTERLAQGEIFETRYCYREDYDYATLFLIPNSEGLFGLVCQPTHFDFVGKAVSAPVDDNTDELAEDFDFNMF